MNLDPSRSACSVRTSRRLPGDRRRVSEFRRDESGRPRHIVRLVTISSLNVGICVFGANSFRIPRFPKPSTKMPPVTDQSGVGKRTVPRESPCAGCVPPQSYKRTAHHRIDGWHHLRWFLQHAIYGACAGEHSRLPNTLLKRRRHVLTRVGICNNRLLLTRWHMFVPEKAHRRNECRLPNVRLRQPRYNSQSPTRSSRRGAP